VFYTAQLSFGALVCAGACVGVLALGNRLGVRRTAFYTIMGLALWVAVLKSGVHATIAGVLLAMTIPARRRIDQATFAKRTRALVDEFAASLGPAQSAGDSGNLSSHQVDVLYSIEHACEGAAKPLHRFERALYPWVALVVMPVFALANAGVAVTSTAAASAMSDPASIGIFLGLVLGKQLGVFAFAWLTVRIGLARLPSGATWPQLYGVAWLCGIGFTMSLFIAALAFTSPKVLDHAKLAILCASTLSAVVGTAVLIMTSGKVRSASHAVGQ
jgi:NhaA family Na+:H+ antiporter